MSLTDLRSALHRLGSASPIALGLAYVFCVVALAGVGELVRGSILGSMVVSILFLALFLLLFITVTWFRHDDWLAAGVLFTLIVCAGVAIPTMLVIVARGGIGPAALWGAMTTSGAVIYAIIFAPIVGGFVALARKLTPEFSRTPA